MKNKSPYTPSFLRLLVCCFAVTTGAYAQDSVKDSIAISKIIKETAKGKEAPYVTAVTNKAHVEAISRYIDVKQAQKSEKDRQASDKYNSSLGRRYCNGDKSTIPQIVAVLNGGNSKAIAQLLDDLEQQEDTEGKSPLYLDPAIKDKLFKLLEKEQLESTIVQFTGYNRVDGYIPAFENRLVSGKSTDEDRIFFWLGYAGSEKAVDYGISQNNIWLIQNLDAYMDNAQEPVKQKLLRYAYGYLEKNPIKKTDIQDIKNSNRGEYIAAPGGNSIKFTLLDFIIKYGDKRTLPIYNNAVALVQEVNPYVNIPLSKYRLGIIKFYSYPQKKEAVMAALGQDDLFFNIIPVIYGDKELAADPAINQLAFANFEKFKKYRYDGTESFVRYVMPVVAKNAFAAFVKKNIKEAALQNDMLGQYEIQKQTLAETNEYLLKNGLVDSPVMIPQKDDALGESTIGHSLSLANITLDFDVEASVYPLDYDDLLLSFTDISKNRIQGLKCYLQYHDDADTTVYNLLVSYKDKCYIMVPSDQDDWYDMEAVNALLAAIVAETGCKEQFINWHNDGQYVSYIFGEHEKVNKLIKDYQLYYPEDEYEE